MGLPISKNDGTLDLSIRNFSGGAAQQPNNGEGMADVLLVDITGRPLVIEDRAAKQARQFGVPMMGANDGTMRLVRTDRYGNLKTGFDNVLFHDDVEGATINTQIWAQSLTTMTMTQSAVGIVFNASGITTLNTAAILTSRRQFWKMPKAPLHARIKGIATPRANSLIEFGFGAPSGVTAQIGNGAFFRYNSGGQLQAVLSYNGGDVNTDTVGATLSATSSYTYDIMCDDDGANFVVCNSAGVPIYEKALTIPATQNRMWSVTHLPAFARVYNSAVAPATAPSLVLTDFLVVMYDAVLNEPVGHQLCAFGGNSLVSPTAFTQTANYANSAAPASATLSNTAAGYTTLGGQFQFAAVAGAETDYNLFCFQVPSPYQFRCTGIRISAMNLGAAVATTPTLLQWGMGLNGASVNLSTGGAIRAALGTQSFPIGAAIGADVPGIDIPFGDAPRVTEAGLFFSVILKMPVGTATASQIVRGTVDVRGYYV